VSSKTPISFAENCDHNIDRWFPQSEEATNEWSRIKCCDLVLELVTEQLAAVTNTHRWSPELKAIARNIRWELKSI
jgi:hypothetical protein